MLGPFSSRHRAMEIPRSQGPEDSDKSISENAVSVAKIILSEEYPQKNNTDGAAFSCIVKRLLETRRSERQVKELLEKKQKDLDVSLSLYEMTKSELADARSQLEKRNRTCGMCEQTKSELEETRNALKMEKRNMEKMNELYSQALSQLTELREESECDREHNGKDTDIEVSSEQTQKQAESEDKDIEKMPGHSMSDLSGVEERKDAEGTHALYEQAMRELVQMRKEMDSERSNTQKLLMILREQAEDKKMFNRTVKLFRPRDKEMKPERRLLADQFQWTARK